MSHLSGSVVVSVIFDTYKSKLMKLKNSFGIFNKLKAIVPFLSIDTNDDDKC